jgi:sugar phosphate isomerase/epimerase
MNAGSDPCRLLDAGTDKEARMLFGTNTHSILGPEPAAANPIQLVLDKLRELVEDYQVDAIELSVDDLLLHPQLRTPEAFSALGDFQQRLPIPFTVHLPFIWIDLSSADELIRSVSVQRMSEALQLTQQLDVRSYVVHATGMLGEVAGPTITDPEGDFRVQISRRSIARSLSELRDAFPNAPLAVENLPGIPFEWQAEYVVANDLGVCCDVGHALLRLGDPVAFIETWADRLLQVHIHGVRQVSFSAGLHLRRDHQLLGGPGELVDTPLIISTLRRVGFDGPVILELDGRTDDGLSHSLATLRAAAG